MTSILFVYVRPDGGKCGACGEEGWGLQRISRAVRLISLAGVVRLAERSAWTQQKGQTLDKNNNDRVLTQSHG